MEEYIYNSPPMLS
uniref:Uncharacterized protein n=1 Tax=Arundo donax TaxID=35708 RepID=A0A0A9E691_ARUDO